MPIGSGPCLIRPGHRRLHVQRCSPAGIDHPEKRPSLWVVPNQGAPTTSHGRPLQSMTTGQRTPPRGSGGTSGVGGGDIWQPARISGMLGSAGRNRLLHHRACMEWGTRPSLGSRHEVLTTLAPEPSEPPMNTPSASVSTVRPEGGLRPAARQPQTFPFAFAQMITASPTPTPPGAGFSGRSVCMPTPSDTLSPKSAPGRRQHRRNPPPTSMNRQDHLLAQRGLTCKNRGQRLTC